MENVSKLKISYKFFLTLIFLIISTIAYGGLFLFSGLGIVPIDHAPSTTMIVKTRVFEGLTVLIVLAMWWMFFKEKYRKAILLSIPMFVVMCWVLLFL